MITNEIQNKLNKIPQPSSTQTSGCSPPIHNKYIKKINANQGEWAKLTKKEINQLYTGASTCGIHTLQVQTAAKLQPSKDNGIWFGSAQGISEQHGVISPILGDEKYRRKLTPSVQMYGNRYTLLSGGEMAHTLTVMTGNQPYYVERVDCTFDSYKYDFDTLYRLNNAVVTLFSIEYDLDNTGETMQSMADGDSRFKNVFAKSKKRSITGKPKRPFEIECYAKYLQYVSSGILARLEIRCLDAGGTVAEGVRRTIAALGEILTNESWARLIARSNARLHNKWKACSRRTNAFTWLAANKWDVVSVEQARTILGEIKGTDGRAAL